MSIFALEIKHQTSNIKHPMSRIRLLPETVASQVAAGEVVERPASVVKELVENSIDAGANKIDVLVRRGGISLLRVIDDGCGMDRDDALLSLERHATSKIQSAADLHAIATLGFRGEALPSIASVSRFRLTTREPNAVAGTEIIVNGGKIDVVRDGGEAPGTQVEVRSLFYNLPARRKFLRTENTESRNIEHQLHLQAIGHSQIAFSFLRDERLVFQLPSTAELIDRLRDLYGSELVARLLPVNTTISSLVRVTGFIGRAGVSRQTRDQQLLFVNGRAIENPVLNAALREGYHTALMRGQYPVTFLFLEIDPAAVDVNVHPAKREVRFRDPRGVREAVVESIRQTLESDRADWQQQFRAPAETPTAKPPRSIVDLAIKAEATTETMPLPGRGDSPNRPGAIEVNRPYLSSAPPAADIQPHARNNQQFQIIGVLNKLYVLMENADGLVLVDQHAAHERILFEELRRRMEEQGVPSQRLLIPQTFDLPPRDAEWVERNMSILQKMGIGIEGFDPNTFKIDSLPIFVATTDPVRFIQAVIDELKSASNNSSPLRLGEDMIAKTVCRHAVKANDPLRYLELEKLIQDLLECDLPFCCPHGRPTMIQISNAELEKKFGRKV
ncbi:MAG: DNA mismatch repair endonuclease MutL [Verrucomicrobiota bacterium]|nr:DNA mismatch repair endonuclease MutL [Verrucomicrobiota bacterium]